jgi:hypothetical protein
VTSDYAWHAVQAAPVALAEINDNVPVIAGDTRVHVSRLSQVVRTSWPLPRNADSDRRTMAARGAWSARSQPKKPATTKPWPATLGWARVASPDHSGPLRR